MQAISRAYRCLISLSDRGIGSIAHLILPREAGWIAGSTQYLPDKPLDCLGVTNGEVLSARFERGVLCRNARGGAY